MTRIFGIGTGEISRLLSRRGTTPSEVGTEANSLQDIQGMDLEGVDRSPAGKTISDLPELRFSSPESVFVKRQVLRSLWGI
jgi:hypothetical protein